MLLLRTGGEPRLNYTGRINMDIAYAEKNNNIINLAQAASKEEAFNRVYYEYADDIFRLCYSFMKNRSDAEDATQETFLRYYLSDKEYESDKHLKAWLIVTASNYCKNLLKQWWRRKRSIDEYNDNAASYDTEIDYMMELVMKLPGKYKAAVYLYYYEEYDSNEIAALLNKPAPTVRSYLQKARRLLRDELDK